MTRDRLIELLREAPQQLIDSELRFKLWAPGRGKAFTVTVEDGWMAGTPWLLFRFHEGPLEGLALWLNGWEPEDGYQYIADCSDDGFLFNSTREDEVVPGGIYLPEWDNVTFFLEK